jgi:hypothetical protein
VTRALEEYIARCKQKGFLDLMGKLEWDSSFDLMEGGAASLGASGLSRTIKGVIAHKEISRAACRPWP